MSGEHVFTACHIIEASKVSSQLRFLGRLNIRTGLMRLLVGDLTTPCLVIRVM